MGGPTPEGCEELFRTATGREPFPYQVGIAEAPVFPALVRIPTGSGKTAAAILGWLYRRRFHPDLEVRRGTPRRLVYCLPMRVLVEQTLDAARGWVERLDLGREVGVFQLMGGTVEDDWARLPERDAILVGTTDMLLSRAMNRGFAASRFRWPMEFGLLNNDCLWVLDEVQLMGNGLATSAQLAAFRQMLGTAAPCPSLWMSATVDPGWLATVDHQPPVSAVRLSEDDLATEVGQRVRAPKRLSRLSVARWPEEGAGAVLHLHRPGTLTLVVVNTVERARRLYEELRRLVQAGLEVHLLHSRFRAPDRRAAVARALARPPAAGRIVVATQVVEAGVDLSAATLVTELSPWGSMVQRFGRCNRFAEYEDAQVAWVDLGEKEAVPYDPGQLDVARERLAGLEGGSVSPAALDPLGPGDPPPVRQVLRRPDLVDLFDTEPDLAGNDVDVSRFIRDDADVDVQVFWRRWDGAEPPKTLDSPSPEELCPVPVWEVRRFLSAGRGRRERVSGFLWDHLARAWRAVTEVGLHPGLTVLLPCEAGGYEATVGWDPGAPGPVAPLGPVEADAAGEEGLEDDAPEETVGPWVPLSEHLGHVRDRLGRILNDLGLALESWLRQALEVAAQWHDVGKAHRVFQEALLKSLPEAERARRSAIQWAKSPLGRPSYERRYFRHELASALALLEAPARPPPPRGEGVGSRGIPRSGPPRESEARDQGIAPRGPAGRAEPAVRARHLGRRCPRPGAAGWRPRPADHPGPLPHGGGPGGRRSAVLERARAQAPGRAGTFPTRLPGGPPAGGGLGGERGGDRGWFGCLRSSWRAADRSPSGVT